MRSIFVGSSEFGIPALKLLLEADPPLLVVTQPDKPAGRRLKQKPCPLAEYAASQGLEVFKPQNINSGESLSRIGKLAPEVIITASYGGMLRRKLRQTAIYEAINLHPSLLPLYRGPTPIQSSLLNGDHLTGVTIFRLTGRMDAGPILAQEELPIEDEDNYSVLHDKLAILAAEMLAGSLPRLEQGEISAREQNESLATRTEKIKSRDLILDWELPAEQVHNHIRAYSFEPGAYSHLRGKNLKILSAVLTSQAANGEPGSIGKIIKNQGFTVNCQDLQLLLRQVKPAGKKAMDAWAFQLGARLSTKDSFSSAHNIIFEDKSLEES